MNTFEKQLDILLEEKDLIALLSNLSAFINESIDNINWAGFYIYKERELVLGPFQGKIACTRIKPGKGVCGTAYINKETIIVKDVNKFEGHIVCDSASKSEIVVPIIVNNEVWGVIDVDSPILDRFKDKEKKMLETISFKLASYLYNS
ncbi:MAG TPA: histidine kinase [Erysipelotrichaceae bacterium]|nr:GAF domain-containing protein [Erysipelotrichaceae bacterium]HCY06985.1 histidine kinase [Erysipelotrichaceae bacterium]